MKDIITREDKINFMQKEIKFANGMIEEYKKMNYQSGVEDHERNIKIILSIIDDINNSIKNNSLLKKFKKLSKW